MVFQHIVGNQGRCFKCEAWFEVENPETVIVVSWPGRGEEHRRIPVCPKCVAEVDRKRAHEGRMSTAEKAERCDQLAIDGDVDGFNKLARSG